MSKKQTVILIDCDGVLVQFCRPVIDFINATAGTSYTLKDIKKDFRTLPGYSEETEKFIRSEGFVKMIPQIEGARDGIESLRSLGKVICVTSPYDKSRHWMPERMEVLKQDFGFKREEVIFAKDKRYVHGDYLIDDLPKNLVDWAEHHRDGIAVAFTQPWNESDDLRYPEGTAIARVPNWQELLGEMIHLEDIFG